jgi:hypothetical protein
LKGSTYDKFSATLLGSMFVLPLSFLVWVGLFEVGDD